MLVRFNCFRASLKDYAVCCYCLIIYCCCRISLSHILCTNSLLDVIRKYIAIFGRFIWATLSLERQSAAFIKSNAWWLFGFCGLARLPSFQLSPPPRTGSLNLLPSMLSACCWCKSKKIDSKITFLLKPKLR